MNEGGIYPDDQTLLADLDRLVHELDPPPQGLVERVRFALELEDLDVEVARWERADPLVGVRSVAQGTITFTVSDLTVMINLTKLGKGNRIDGWLVPAGQYRVEVRVAGHESTATIADDVGRFVLHDVPPGTTQIVVYIDGVPGRRTIVTPAVVL
ncbi:hypothetical protein BAY61_29720 [Prauserella marina]|uniref:Uncharacterized protein n=1 Tax=Prauserella marina TaxID=530584 RepID=A0A222VX33_9PSEU|nr:hypothetical protein [Prauserella marina]ASR38488.1 hypothetical protein BAY61_29720 [Prauserella marina]PWV81781.1 hypothetical protein DES30_10211 [Prauserella marina]SDD12201.1 hypothetical protein SAMN05421630_10611 [Prauserella marina]